jgi:hypothetical protein
MKKILLVAAIMGMACFTFGQQQQTASKDTKDTKCSKACMKSCGDKNCKKGDACCTKGGKKTTSATSTTSTTTTSDKK